MAVEWPSFAQAHGSVTRGNNGVQLAAPQLTVSCGSDTRPMA